MSTPLTLLTFTMKFQYFCYPPFLNVQQSDLEHAIATYAIE